MQRNVHGTIGGRATSVVAAWRRPGRRDGEVGDQRVELSARRRRVGELEAVGELVDGQASLDAGVVESRRDLFTLAVRGAQETLFGHAGIIDARQRP